MAKILKEDIQDSFCCISKQRERKFSEKAVYVKAQTCMTEPKI